MCTASIAALSSRTPATPDRFADTLSASAIPFTLAVTRAEEHDCPNLQRGGWRRKQACRPTRSRPPRKRSDARALEAPGDILASRHEDGVRDLDARGALHTPSHKDDAPVLVPARSIWFLRRTAPLRWTEQPTSLVAEPGMRITTASLFWAMDDCSGRMAALGVEIDPYE